MWSLFIGTFPLFGYKTVVFAAIKSKLSLSCLAHWRTKPHWISGQKANRRPLTWYISAQGTTYR